MKKIIVLFVISATLFFAVGCGTAENPDPETFPMSDIGVVVNDITLHCTVVWRSETWYLGEDKFSAVFGASETISEAIVNPLSGYFRQLRPLLEDDTILYKTELSREEVYKIQEALDLYYESQKDAGKEGEPATEEEKK
ncbi:MAG: hypothetical protein LBQ02_03660 [Candidatus Nomurabacteria bacterium]|jgi:hypothetical protein|nr:hypothetical protein [Candidatus Nomurabacteria bacterium]